MKKGRDLDYINRAYGTDYAVGDTVLYTGGKEPTTHTIIGTCGPYLMCKREEGRQTKFHPTWKIEKIPTPENKTCETCANITLGSLYNHPTPPCSTCKNADKWEPIRSQNESK